MFGDDPDPTVTKVRFGFEEVSDTGEGSMRLRFRQEDKRRIRLVSERTTERRGNYERTKSFKKTCGCNADDAMMNATNK